MKALALLLNIQPGIHINCACNWMSDQSLRHLLLYISLSNEDKWFNNEDNLFKILSDQEAVSKQVYVVFIYLTTSFLLQV